MQTKRGFTLIEVLVVIAIVAVLSVTVVLTLNPQELLRQARDARRLADIEAINKTIAVYETEIAHGVNMEKGFSIFGAAEAQAAGKNSPIIGTSTAVYVSLPSASANCATHDLPQLATGYQYACVSPEKVNSIDGGGWLPLDMRTITGATVFTVLPIDPINTAESGLYYSFQSQGGTWVVSAAMESKKYRTQTVQPLNAPNSYRYERGNNLELAKLSTTVATTSTSTSDAPPLDQDPKSGGTLIGTVTCRGADCVSGTTGREVLLREALSAKTPATITFWMDADLQNALSSTGMGLYDLFASEKAEFQVACKVIAEEQKNSAGARAFITATFDGSNQAELFIDAVNQAPPKGSETCSYNPEAKEAVFDGELQGITIYGYVLNSEEIQARHQAELK